MLECVQIVMALIIGVVASITDFRDKKIYNKDILVAFIISFGLYIIFWRQIEMEYVVNIIVNFAIATIVSFCFFYFKIWAAGDAKLFLSIVFMIPYEMYETKILNFFPALNLLIIIFSIAFIYIVFETFFLWGKDDKKFERFRVHKMSKNEVIDWTISYFMGYFLITFANNILYKFWDEFVINNAGLTFLCNMLLLMFVYRTIIKRDQMIIMLSIAIVANIIYYVTYGFPGIKLDPTMFLIVFTIMLFKEISEEYNYETIKIEDLKDRMILSYGSVLKFYGSKVRGLPKYTTENTDSRLTKEEVEAIKRWSKTKKGTAEITIVRHLPFAPFMLCGEIIFFILRICS